MMKLFIVFCALLIGGCVCPQEKMCFFLDDTTYWVCIEKGELSKTDEERGYPLYRSGEECVDAVRRSMEEYYKQQMEELKKEKI